MSTFKLFKAKSSSTGHFFKVHAWNCFSFDILVKQPENKPFTFQDKRVYFERKKIASKVGVFALSRTLRACSSCVASVHFIKTQQGRVTLRRNVQRIFHKRMLSAVKKMKLKIKREIAVSHVGKRTRKTTCPSKLLLRLDSGNFKV